MAGTTGFFDAVRQYTAQEFARALRAASTPGVVQGIGNQYAVTAGPGLGVTVDTGFVTILGNWRFDDTTQAVALLAADVTNARIDRIVARLTISAKTVEITKLTGTPAGSPVAPALTQGSDVYEVPLAQIAVAANAASITSGNVTDQRQYSGAVLSDHKHTGLAGGGGTLGRGTAVTSAATITLPTDGKIISIAGATSITTITTGTQGREVILEFQSAGCLVVNGSNLKLVGNYLSTALGTLTLQSDGTNWIEVGRTPAGTAWTAFTPTGIGQGGSLTFTATRCRYQLVGKTAIVQFTITLTAAGTAGASIQMGLPAPLTPAADGVVGAFYYQDTGTSFYAGTLLISGGVVVGVVHAAVAGFFGIAPNFAAANTDIWGGQMTYEIA